MKIEDYLKFYIGQECRGHKGRGILRGFDAQYFMGEAYVMITTKENQTPDEDYITNDYSCKASDVKLYLRPLSSMTEEEMKGLLMAMVPIDMEDAPTAEDYDLEMFYNDGGLMVDGDVAIGANYTCRCYEGQIAIRQNGDIDCYDEDGKEREKVTKNPQAMHYLLSRGFDLFGLIPAGLAINSKKEKV